MNYTCDTAGKEKTQNYLQFWEHCKTHYLQLTNQQASVILFIGNRHILPWTERDRGLSSFVSRHFYRCLGSGVKPASLCPQPCWLL